MTTIEVTCDRVGDGLTCRVALADETGMERHPRGPLPAGDPRTGGSVS